MTTSYRHGSIVGPVLLIGFGAVLLLDNLGLLGQSPWTALLQLWPVILVSVGLDLAIGYRSRAGAATAAALSLIVLGGAIAWLAEADQRQPLALPGEMVQVELNGVTSAEVLLAPVASALHVGSAGGRDLLAGREDCLVSRRGSRPELSAHRRPRSGQARDGWRFGRPDDGVLRIFPDMGPGPYAHDPAGDCCEPRGRPGRLALAPLTAEGLAVDLVFGQSTVVLPANGKYDARLSGVFGQTVVVIPAGLEASVRIEPLLTARPSTAASASFQTAATSRQATASPRTRLTW